MKYIDQIREGDRLNDVYLCKYKQSAMTKNGKVYENVILQDKTGTINAKIWDPHSGGIEDFEVLDYVEVVGDVSNFQGTLQVSIRRVRRAREDEYRPEDYLPVSDYDAEEMYTELCGVLATVENPHLRQLIEMYFMKNENFKQAFQFHSAAKAAHHGELEYGSPKKPALMEAVALNLADNTDAKMESFREILKSAGGNQGWLGYNRIFESNVRRSSR